LKAEVEAAGAWRVRLGAALESGPLRMGSTKRGWLWLVTITGIEEGNIQQTGIEGDRFRALSEKGYFA